MSFLEHKLRRAKAEKEPAEGVCSLKEEFERRGVLRRNHPQVVRPLPQHTVIIADFVRHVQPPCWETAYIGRGPDGVLRACPYRHADVLRRKGFWNKHTVTAQVDDPNLEPAKAIGISRWTTDRDGIRYAFVMWILADGRVAYDHYSDPAAITDLHRLLALRLLEGGQLTACCALGSPPTPAADPDRRYGAGMQALSADLR